MKRIGILLADGAEELEFIAPLHVFGTASRLGADCMVSTLSERSPVTCRFGTRVHVASRIELAPVQDVLFVPASIGAYRIGRAHHHIVPVTSAAAFEIALAWVGRLWDPRLARAVQRMVHRPPSTPAVPSGVRGLV